MAIHPGDSEFDYPGSPYQMQEGYSGGGSGGGGFLPPGGGGGGPFSISGRAPGLTPTLPGSYAGAFQRNRLRPFGFPSQGGQQGPPAGLLQMLAGLGGGMGASPFSGIGVSGGGTGYQPIPGSGGGGRVGGVGGGGGAPPPGYTPPHPPGGYSPPMPPGGQGGNYPIPGYQPIPGSGRGGAGGIGPGGIVPPGGVGGSPGAGSGPGLINSWDIISSLLRKAFEGGQFDPATQMANIRSQAISDAGAGQRAAQLQLAGRSNVDPSTFGFQNLMSQLQGQSDISQSLSHAQTQMQQQQQQRLYDILGKYYQGQLGQYLGNNNSGGFDWGGLLQGLGGLLGGIL